MRELFDASSTSLVSGVRDNIKPFGELSIKVEIKSTTPV